jgi:hypothetical protein
MKSHIRASKASKSTKRKVHEIVNGIGRYTPARLMKRWRSKQEVQNHRSGARRL